VVAVGRPPAARRLHSQQPDAASPAIAPPENNGRTAPLQALRPSTIATTATALGTYAQLDLEPYPRASTATATS
jgi:hypothetical protein